jgi:hypothetical protein
VKDELWKMRFRGKEEKEKGKEEVVLARAPFDKRRPRYF